MINTELSDEVTRQVKIIQQLTQDAFGDSLWLTPPESLHMTLLDWVAPLVDYHEDKDALFKKLRPRYDIVLSSILDNSSKQHITFNRLIVSPSAIAIVADDAAPHFNKIRQDFLSQVALPPDTKQPPTIVHVTIGRFVQEYDPAKAEVFTRQRISIKETLDHFRLVRESKLPMLNYTTLRSYPLY